MRNIARYAAVYLYNAVGDMLWGNRCFPLAVDSQSEEEHTLRLPTKTNVEDSYDDNVLHRRVSQLVLSMKKWENRLLLLQDCGIGPNCKISAEAAISLHAQLGCHVALFDPVKAGCSVKIDNDCPGVGLLQIEAETNLGAE